MVSNDDIKNIIKYKSFLNKEDSNILINNIKNKKVSEIIISPTYNEIYSIDTTPVTVYDFDKKTMWVGRE